MVYQAPFKLEQFMDAYENDAKFNLGETCCYSLSINDIEKLTDTKFDYTILNQKRLTYSWIKGSDELRDQISGLYEGPLTRDNVIVTNGAIGANFLAIYSLIGPGDHVIVCGPIYEQLHSVPRALGATVDILSLSFDEGFAIDLNKLKSLVKPNTKMIVINNPNNPTGTIINTETLVDIVDIAKTVDAYVLCDEVYRPLFHSLDDGEEQPKSIVQLYGKGISTSSMSKAFSLAGIRLGWIASSDVFAVNECLARRDFNMISVSILDDLVAQYGLVHKDAILHRNFSLCKKNLQLLDECVANSQGRLEMVRPKAGTTAFVKVNGANTEELCLKLIKKFGTLAAPGETFDMPGYIRVGFGNGEEDMTNGLKFLLECLQ